MPLLSRACRLGWRAFGLNAALADLITGQGGQQMGIVPPPCCPIVRTTDLDPDLVLLYFVRRVCVFLWPQVPSFLTDAVASVWRLRRLPCMCA